MLRTSIYASIWVLLITIALVGTNMYFNPAITLSSLQQDKAVVEKAADDATKAQVHHELRINIGKLKNDRGQLIA
jgi:hypothetical protein